jgi:hypothetical protein
MSTFHAVVWMDHAEAHVLMFDSAHEVLLTGAGNARTEFKTWCDSHAKACAHTIIENIPSDHPTDPQLIALARKYFGKFDKMAGDPSLL